MFQGHQAMENKRSVISALGRLRQENCKLETNLGYTDFVSKKKKKKSLFLLCLKHPLGPLLIS
jgi:hypothetical protein